MVQRLYNQQLTLLHPNREQLAPPQVFVGEVELTLYVA